MPLASKSQRFASLPTFKKINLKLILILILGQRQHLNILLILEIRNDISYNFYINKNINDNVLLMLETRGVILKILEPDNDISNY